MRFSFLSILRSSFFATACLAAGCGSSAPPRDDGATCEARSKAYKDFLAAHRACSVDPDCTVIGDCGPNADFAAVRSDSSTEARALQQARCGGASDGPVYRAVCRAGQCELEMRTDTCCGCPPSDAGVGDGG